MSGLDRFETWTDAERRRAQWERLSTALPELRRSNAFYRAKLSDRASGLSDLPFTTKIEVSEDQGGRPRGGRRRPYPRDAREDRDRAWCRSVRPHRRDRGRCPRLLVFRA